MRKSSKEIIILIIVTLMIRIIAPIVFKISYATEKQSWDISENKDKSITATLDKEGTLTISGAGNMKNWSEAPWYSVRSLIKHVTIEEGVTNIGNNAFFDCENLTYITISEGVTTIGSYAFYYCSSLRNIAIPNSITNIENYVFRGCSSLENIYVGENNTKYSDENGVLFNKDRTEIVRYPEGKIEEQYIILEGVTNIGEEAFYKCSNLTNITIPESVTTIEKYAFSDCKSLTKVTIPNSVMSIGDYAFYGCESLANITMIKGVTNIKEGTFWGCSNLTNIIIPESVINIEKNAFSKCSSLENIYVEENNANYSDENGVLFNKNKTEIIRYPEGKKETQYVILEGVTSIGEDAFDGCSSLENITIPEGVTDIGWMAFCYCSSLKNITIPKSVTSIGRYAFYYCSSLENIYVEEDNVNYSDENGVLFNKDKTEIVRYPEGKEKQYIIPKGVTNIGEYAFYGCKNLTDITIPSSVTKIEEYAFYKCSDLKNITIPKEVTNIEAGVFLDVDVTIICKSGTLAETYAKEKNLNYILDDEAPTLTTKYSTIEMTEEDIKVTITSNEKIQAIEGWTKSSDELTLTKTYEKNSKEKVIVEDLAGNQTEVIITINNIEKTEEPNELEGRGDINEDGKIDSTDVIAVLRHIAVVKSESAKSKQVDWFLEEEKQKNADINRDGNIDTTDVLSMFRHIAATKSDEIKQKHEDWIIQ